MRYLILITAMWLGTGCHSVQKAESTAAAVSLNGTWMPVKQEMGGKELPAAGFAKQKLTIKDTTYTLIAESADKGTLVYKNGKMDIYGKAGVNKGRHLTAIYKLERNLLTICYNLKGDAYPSGFETKADAMLFLSVFKRVPVPSVGSAISNE